MRISETRRGFRANYYETTLTGIWAAIEGDARSTEKKVEENFPAFDSISVDRVGELPVQIVVFTRAVKPRSVPHGVFFTLNGQVHGALPDNFVTSELNFSYLSGHLFVSVDCTGMPTLHREDFLMASRDRVRRNETYDAIHAALRKSLRDHPGLRALNAKRRAETISRNLEDESLARDTLAQLLSADPSLAALFGLGGHLVAGSVPTTTDSFEGRRYPTFFDMARASDGHLTRHVPLGRHARIEFSTDAENAYFQRDQSPGTLGLTPDNVYVKRPRLFNGACFIELQLPDGAKVGDSLVCELEVSDPDRESRGLLPFTAQVTLVADPAETRPVKRGTRKRPRKAAPTPKSRRPTLAMPHVVEVRHEKWGDHTPPFTETTALRIAENQGDSPDFLVNMDNTYLKTELASARPDDQMLIGHQFKWGLAIAALGILQHGRKQDEATRLPSETVAHAMDGLAAVIVPVVRNLNRPIG